MKRNGGFTLVELIVVIAILATLLAMASSVYNVWRQRAYGSEAAVVMKQILDGEIMYYLEHDEFFPEVDSEISVWANDPPSADSVRDIRNAINIYIPVGHHLDYTIRNDGDSCYIFINASFPLFKNGETYLWAILDKTGTWQYIGPEDLGG